MLKPMRSRLALTLATVLAVAACNPEGDPLATTVDATETNADVAAVEAPFATPSAESFLTVGSAINDALESQPLLLAPETVLPVASAIPLTALGKTFVYDTLTNEYVVSALTGAPANSVRFRLYAVDINGDIIEPLTQVGYVDFATASNIATAKVYSTGDVQVLDYTVTTFALGGATGYSVSGWAGNGTPQVEFTLGLGVSTGGNPVVTWHLSVPARNLSTTVRVTRTSTGPSASYLISGTMRSGLRKIEMTGTVTEANGGTLIVSVGNKVFGKVVVGAGFGSVTVTDPSDAPLGGTEAAALTAVYHFFESAVEAPLALVGPLAHVLGLDLD